MKKILIITVTLLTYSIVFGQISYNEIFQVNTYTNDLQLYPSCAELVNGGFVICWHSIEQDSEGAGIFAQLFFENGIKKGNEFQVNTYTNNWQQYSTVAGLSNGNFVVCWVNRSQYGWDSEICSQRYDENGIKIGNEFQVNTYIQNYQYDPSVTGLSNGNFVVCWTSRNQDGNGHGIYAQLYSENGDELGDEFQVNTYTEDSQMQQCVSGLSTGGFVICWESYEQDGSEYGIYAQMYDENGVQIGNEFQVNTYTANSQLRPYVAGLSTGRFVVCWHSFEQDGSGNGIFAQIYNNNGITIGNEFQVNTYTAWSQKNSTVTDLLNGNFIIFWETWIQGNHYKEISAQKYNEAGIKIGNEFRVSTTFSYGADWPSYSVNGLSTGNLIVCWQGSSQEGDDRGIFGKYYLDELINHSLIPFELLEPQLDATLDYRTPLFKWNKATETRLNFPWELTYDLYIDNDVNLTNPIIRTGLLDTTYRNDTLTAGQTYFWKVLARNYYGDSLWSSDVFGFYIDQNATDIKEIEAPLPESFELYQNYPNPFNPTTKIQFTIPVNVISTEGRNLGDFSSSSTSRNDNRNVVLKVYDILGNEIATLVNEQKPPGNYEIEFSASGGQELSSGIYFYKLNVGKYSETKKMLLMK